ncbi:MAG: SDR family oxidoreductase [Sphingomonadales bacterium]
MHSHGKTVLITGAAKRIGRAIALDLAAHGWDIAVHYGQSAEHARDVVREVEAMGRRAAAVSADLASEDETGALVNRARDALGDLSLVVNNASLFEEDDFATVTRESWDMHLDVNLRAPFLICQKFVDALAPGQHGNIVNIIDQRVWRLTPRFMSYTLSKAGLWTLTRTMAQALAPRVRVNAIGPGPILPSTRQSEEDFAAQARSLPLERPANASEIAAAIRFILETPSMTGQMIALDGGQHLSWQTPDVIGQGE